MDWYRAERLFSIVRFEMYPTAEQIGLSLNIQKVSPQELSKNIDIDKTHAFLRIMKMWNCENTTFCGKLLGEWGCQGSQGHVLDQHGPPWKVGHAKSAVCFCKKAIMDEWIIINPQIPIFVLFRIICQFNVWDDLQGIRSVQFDRRRQLQTDNRPPLSSLHCAFWNVSTSSSRDN